MFLTSFPAVLISFILLFIYELVQAVEPEVDQYEIFRSSFNAPTINNSQWNAANFSSIFNGEIQYYRPENVFIIDGVLHLQAKKEIFGGRNFTSGRVDTFGKFNFLYGEIEWRARVPKGKGLWSALRLLEARCSTGVFCLDEPVSISMLDVRGDQTDETVLSVARKQTTTITNKVDMALDFHVYKLIWHPKQLSWWIDGVQVLTYTDGLKIPSVRMQLAMNLAVGGWLAKSPDQQSKFPADFLIDYVVVRQNWNETRETVAARGRKGVAKVWFPIVIALGSLFGGVLITVLAVCFIRRRRRQKKAKTVPPSFSDHNYTTPIHLSQLYQQSSGSDSGNGSTCSPDELNAYFRLLEVPVSNIVLSEELLGKGQFGAVWKGFILSQEGKHRAPVAVKIILENGESNHDALQTRLFLEEIKVMTKVGRHLNIVNLLGHVTAGRPMMILEFCSHGSLLRYLRSHRLGFINRVDRNGLLLADSVPNTPTTPVSPATTTSGCLPGYVAMVSNQNFLVSPSPTAVDNSLSTDDLLHITYQISRGLEYLAEKSIIHRDIAARNVLVCDDNIVKICDFGLARRRLLADYVLHDDQVALPLKWMAPESIFEKSFSYKSDIWSLGILMWEIFSLGQTPYSTLAGTAFSGHIIEFAQCISNGLRMERPTYAPVFIFEIMNRCWDIEKDQRPSAARLRTELSTHVTNNTADYYLKLDEPYQQYNRVNRALMEAVLNTEVFVDESTVNTNVNVPANTSVFLTSPAYVQSGLT